MDKNFDDFLDYAENNSRECQAAAESALVDYKNEDGTFNLEDSLNAAYSTNRAATLALLRQYHDWANK
ncbi:MAG: hypothetical protein RR842_14345 [Gordonibacter sp.]|uniref:hypothetical protein n=1 Tax=Gordonibacter sp. TaxID=1968902 RepID=UPI002FC8F002